MTGSEETTLTLLLRWRVGEIHVLGNDAWFQLTNEAQRCTSGSSTDAAHFGHRREIGDELVRTERVGQAGAVETFSVVKPKLNEQMMIGRT